MIKKAILFVSLIYATNASATCTKPSGTYVGGTGGPVIYSGTTIGVYAAQIFSITISSSGATITETGTSTSGGDYQTVYSIASSNISFSTTTCTGKISIDTTHSTFYSSSDSGNTITLIARGGTAGTAYVAPYPTILKKV